MKATVEENGVLIPRALLGDAREVEIVQEGDHLRVQPIPVEPKYSIWDLGKDPAKGGPRDGSVNHDKYFAES